MIDWWLVISNAVWICGCALALAAVSYASWRANAGGERLRAALGRPKIRRTLSMASILFCLGLAATSRAMVEIVIWLALAGLGVAHMIRDGRGAVS